MAPSCRSDVRWYRPLTVRENCIVDLVIQGLTYATIASRLGISDRTVAMHVVNAANKMAECGAVPLALSPKQRVFVWGITRDMLALLAQRPENATTPRPA